jgi:NhaP-type Na+/H+ or K+/H+ antiporter
VAGLAAFVARRMPERTNARDRINSNAVWVAVIFVLNVLAFLLMGLQARIILTQLEGAALIRALRFAGLVLATVILVRFAWVMAYGTIVRRVHSRRSSRGAAPSVSVGILVSWCGMRGLVTLAAALALPAQFPQREVIVLSAFTVVLGTLVVQGFTLRPLTGWLRIARDSSLDEDVARTRDAMLAAALEAIRDETGSIADEVRSEFNAARRESIDRTRPTTSYDALRRRGLEAERRLLNDWRNDGRIADDVYHHLEDELDRSELDLASAGASWLED